MLQGDPIAAGDGLRHTRRRPSGGADRFDDPGQGAIRAHRRHQFLQTLPVTRCDGPFVQEAVQQQHPKSVVEGQDDRTVALTPRQTSSLGPCPKSRVGAEGQFGDQIEPDPAVCGPMIAEKAGMYAMVSRRKRRKPARLHNPPHAFNMSRVDEQIDITTRGRAEIGRSAQQAPAHTRLLESEKHGFQHRVQHRLAFHVRQPHNRLIKNRGEAA